tara:strand:- start:3163 stop:3903 length:741 start_codon:yes stop_codon:yes gene_type:complete
MCKAPKLSDFDPTTGEGLLNIATLGQSGQIKEGLRNADEALMDFDDQISGQEEKEAAEEAAAQQETAAREALNLQERIYEEGQAKLDPFYQGGIGSLDDYLGLIDPEGAAAFKANYLEGDEFQNILEQGTNQLESNAAFSGALGSGGTLKNVADHTTDQSFNLSNQALERELGRLGQGVSLGQSAAGSQVSAGQNFGQQAGQQYRNIGNAQATGTLAGAPTGIAPYLQLAGTGANIYSAYNSGANV